MPEVIAIFRDNSGRIANLAQRLREVSISSLAYLYLFAIVFAESTVNLASTTVGTALHLTVFTVLIVHSTQAPQSGMLLSLSLVPLIRIVSLGLPLESFERTWWFFLTGTPLVAAALIVVHATSWSRGDIGLRLPRGSHWITTGVVAASGVLIGAVDRYLIEVPDLVTGLSLAERAIVSLSLLLGGGLTEELIYRGVLQAASIASLGILRGIVFVSILFAVMQMGHGSMAHVMLAFVVGLYFGYVRYRTGTLLGVVAAHTVINIAHFMT